MTAFNTPPDAFASLEEYTLARPCPTCKAPRWTPCEAPRKTPGVSHVRRSDAGSRHYRRDFGNAPWPEDMEPGKCYSTIPARPE